MKYETVDELAAEVTAKFGQWNMWRTAMGQWHISAKQASQDFEATCDGIGEAMRAALQWRALPLVPREKRRLSEELFEPVRSGVKWRLLYDSMDVGARFDRKSDAMEFARRKVEYSIAESESWELMYGWSRNATEGVDFRYAN